MAITSGTRLGSYEIVALIGAGGMGEVYRARDVRIGRDVAIKVLPDDLVANHDRLARFQREAQSAGSLNHPNLLTIHELGTDEGRTFIVSELLDGVTLRERLSGGALAPRRAIEYATQIAAGLAAAHERGIVHRDLKPENIFITRDGRLKILDFGLAKVTAPAGGDLTDAKTAAQLPGTNPGTVLGTAGYMSPEQVRGEEVDARSDIFSLGAILYEMVSGRRAFHGSSSVDTMHAILHGDPPELSSTGTQVPPVLERIINHCLEKNPEQRFQSARDLAFDLGTISGSSSDGVAPRKRAMPRAMLLWIAALAAVAVASWFASRATVRTTTPQFHRVTFQSRPTAHAVFSPDEQSIIYSTPYSGSAEEVLMSGLGNPESRNLGLASARVLSVSSRGELAILQAPRAVGGFTVEGTLARVPLSGGAPRAVLENVQEAQWTPSGDDFLVMRNIGGKTRIEMPIGKPVYETAGWAQSARISPDGRAIAWIEHPVWGDDGGSLRVLEIGAKSPRKISQNYQSIQGLAWDPDGKRIWFTASAEGNQSCLYRTSSGGGNARLMISAPGRLEIHAIARDGRALVSASDVRLKLQLGKTTEQTDRDLSWLDWSLDRDITPDGKYVLFDETGNGGGKNYSVYMRPTDGGPAVRLGDGVGMAFSPDGKSVLALQVADPPQLFLYSTGAGQPVQLTHDAMRYTLASWVPDGKSVLYIASDAQAARLYVQDLSTGKRRPLSPPGVSQAPRCSPDSKWVALFGPDRIPTLYPLQGGAEVKLPEISSGYGIAGWSADSRHLYLMRRDLNPGQIVRFDLDTRSMQTVKEFAVPDAFVGASGTRITPDGSTYVFSYQTNRSDLYVIDGLK